MNKEEINSRLMLLTILKGWRFLLYGLLFGAMIFSAVYYLSIHNFNGGEDYESRGMILIDYADDVEKAGIYINELTWSNLASSDLVYENVILETDSHLLKDELKAKVTVLLESDIRVLVIKVRDKDPKFAQELCQAYLDAFIALQDEFEDVDSLRIIDNAEAGFSMAPDDKVLNVAILGAIVGFIVALGCIILYFIFDDTVKVPHTISAEFDVKCLGTLIKDLSKVNFKADNIYIDMPFNVKRMVTFEMAILKDNMRSVFDTGKKIRLVDLDRPKANSYGVDVLNLVRKELFIDYRHKSDRGEAENMDAVYEKDEIIIYSESVIDNPVCFNEITEDEIVILMVKASSTSKAYIHTMLDHLKGLNVDVAGIILYDADNWLLSSLFFPKKKAGEY